MLWFSPYDAHTGLGGQEGLQAAGVGRVDLGPRPKLDGNHQEQGGPGRGRIDARHTETPPKRFIFDLNPVTLLHDLGVGQELVGVDDGVLVPVDEAVEGSAEPWGLPADPAHLVDVRLVHRRVLGNVDLQVP